MAEFATLIDQWYLVQLRGLRTLYPVFLVAEPYDCDTPSFQPPLLTDHPMILV